MYKFIVGLSLFISVSTAFSMVEIRICTQAGVPSGVRSTYKGCVDRNFVRIADKLPGYTFRRNTCYNIYSNKEFKICALKELDKIQVAINRARSVNNSIDLVSTCPNVDDNPNTMDSKTQDCISKAFTKLTNTQELM